MPQTVNTSRLVVHVSGNGSCRTQLPGGVLLVSPTLSGMLSQLSTYNLSQVRQVVLNRTSVSSFLHLGGPPQLSS